MITLPAGPRQSVGFLAVMSFCVACGGGSAPLAGAQSTATSTSRVDCIGIGRVSAPPENLCQTLSPGQQEYEARQNAKSYPVCGVGLGPSYRDLSTMATTQFLLGNDATQGAPEPAPVQYANEGMFVLKVAPGCEHGDEIRIEPPSAAEITARAPAADGKAAGVAIQARVREFRIVGSGAVAFDQQVKLICQGRPGDPCPADPSTDDGGYPEASPLPTPWDPNLRP
jgi:hypothetical protein